ncbi:DUF3841 domain-containing protein [Nocardia huaxiensis]|uniref:DUF3841 domain-containing protein n=1 Tax=Nocardia huaxiensis TaxID=2755382 RepID=UPI001FD10944|nr:DUF3841 domain-containing protein [Nocardia huaxiensis]
MRLWTLQAPEVVHTLRSTGVYRADWALVTGNWKRAFQDMVDEMARRGIDCHGAPPVWCWTVHSPFHRTATSLLGYPDWLHGRWLLTLDVPDALTLPTSYAVWNDYLGHTMGFADEPTAMDWSGRRTWKYDELQVTIPELRLDWVLRAGEYPPDPETAAAAAKWAREA